ncbi:MAG: lysophospholipid acyltransferase family protein [Thermodesulfobacteriota bacterium]
MKLKKILKSRIVIEALTFLGSLLIRFIAATMRFTHVNFDHLQKRLDEGGKIIVAFWHGRLLMMTYASPGHIATLLVSRHGDGELLARVLERFGMKCVRGSSTRGGAEGMMGLVRAAAEGEHLVITPDGPRGPVFEAKMGAVKLASMTGLPIMPWTFGASKKKPLRAGTGLSCPLLSREGSLSAATPFM